MAKTMVQNIYIEREEHKISDKEIIAKIKEVWVNDGNKVKDINTLDVYPKANENKAYYVINGEITGDIDLFV